MKRKILLSVVVASTLSFIGCDSGSGSDTNTTQTSSSSSSSSSGAVVDGYIKNANVCIDLNGNLKCDPNEPTAKTDANGKYNITTTEDINGKFVIASGGFDINRGEDFNSTFISKLDNNLNSNLTPLTTMTYFYSEQHNVPFDNAKYDVAKILGITANDVESDPMQNENVEKVSLKLEVIVETAAKLKNESTTNIFKLLAHNASTDDNLSNVIDKSFNDKNIKTAVNYLVNADINQSNIKTIQDIVLNTAKTANSNDMNLTQDMINHNIEFNAKLEALNLNKIDFYNKVNSMLNETNTDATNKIANEDNAKNLVSEIRDTTYEFLDPNKDNQDDNTSTIAGEVVKNYKSAIKPAIDNLNSDINSSVNSIDEATKQFDKDLKEFNNSIADLNDRLKAITKIINDNNVTDDYNDSTSFDDTVSHTYSKDDDGYITEVYSINDKNLTAKYYEDRTENSYLATDPISLSKDGEYNISLNSLSFDGNKFIFDANGVVYDDNDTDKKIKFSDIKLAFDADTNKFDNSVDKTLAFSNIDLNITGNVITKNGTFDGEIVFNNNKKYLKGILDYSNFNGVKLNGNLIINEDSNNLLNLSNDDENKLKEYVDISFINNDLVIKKVFYNWIGNHNISFYEENLTSINGETAHCSFINKFQNNSLIHTANCDKNVTSIEYPYNKIIKAEVNGKKVLLDNFKWHGYDNDDDEKEIWAVDFDFEAADRKDYKISYDFDTNSTKYYVNGNESNFTISNINVKKAKDVLDVPGDIKLNADVTTPKANLTLKLTAQSDGNGKVYHIIAQDVNISNGDNFASINKLNIDKTNTRYELPSYYSDCVVTYNDFENNGKNEENTTKVTLEGLNAKLNDTNNNPIEIKDTNLLLDLSSKDAYFYGTISYLDFTLNGFISGVAGYKNNGLLYLNIQRDNYEPFTLGYKVSFNKDEANNEAVIKKGDYSIYLTHKDSQTNKIDETKGYDSNGVFIKIDKSRDENNITLSDKNKKSLATFDPKTNTFTYEDGSSETIY